MDLVLVLCSIGMLFISIYVEGRIRIINWNLMGQRQLKFLKPSLDTWTIEYRVHATQRMFKRNIEEKDVYCLLADGTVIEEYKDDFPFPSVLISGMSNNRPLHAVIGIDADSRRLFLITIYEPDPAKWSENYSKRLSP